MIDVVVMAHPKRDAAACALYDQFMVRGYRLPWLVWDEINDEWDTGSRAWQRAASVATDWAVVVQDDALPVTDARLHMQTALRSAPRTAVSFYVGTGRPRAHRVTHAVNRARQQSASWLQCDSLLWGVAIALPAEHITPMLQWAATSSLPYDQRISAYYRRHLRTPVRHTWPSLVDHADGEGLVHHNRPTVPRRAHQTGPWQPNGPTIDI